MEKQKQIKEIINTLKEFEPAEIEYIILQASIIFSNKSQQKAV